MKFKINKLMSKVFPTALLSLTAWLNTANAQCSNAMYLSQTSTLYSIDTSNNPFLYPSFGTSPVNYNAIGVNPLDGIIYGMQVSNSNNLLKINLDGTVTNLGAVKNLPIGIYNSGEIDDDGNYYIKNNTNNSIIYKINLTTKTATVINLSKSFMTADFAYSVITGLLYGVNTVNGQLYSINPLNGVVTDTGIAAGFATVGAMYTSSTGEVFGVNNNKGFYQFNLITGDRILISGTPLSDNNDGAHCVTRPITFTADLSVTKTDGTNKYDPGTSTTYTITVTNDGPFGVLNAKVSDPVPAGIPAANVKYTAVASSGSTTSVSGTQTGAIDDFVGLPVGGTVTYTVVVNIPFSFTGSLSNTVTVVPPSNITDSDLANNSATDTDNSDVCYKPGILGIGLPVNHGMSSLGRAATEGKDKWPMVRQGAWTALESKTKGFVINRLTTAQISAIPAANLTEGMMIYNVTLNCLQINTTGTAAGWSCLNTQTCPN